MMIGRTTMRNKLRIFKGMVTDFHIESMIKYMKNLKKIMSLKNVKIIYKEIVSPHHLNIQIKVLKFL